METYNFKKFFNEQIGFFFFYLFLEIDLKTHRERLVPVTLQATFN